MSRKPDDPHNLAGLPLDEASLTEFLADVDRAMSPLLAKWGLTIRMRLRALSEDHGYLRVELARRRLDGVLLGKEAHAFLSRATEFGLQPAELGAVFAFEGGRYRIVGLKPRAKNAVVAERIDKHELDERRFPAAQVRALLDHDEHPALQAPPTENATAVLSFPERGQKPSAEPPKDDEAKKPSNKARSKRRPEPKANEGGKRRKRKGQSR